MVRLAPDTEGFAWYEAYSEEMTMFGEASILGKSLVVYADNVTTSAEKLTDNSVVDEKAQHLTNAEDYVKRVGKPVACCTIKQTKYF